MVKENLVSVRVGLAVSTEEMSSEQLWEQIYNQFKGHVAKFAFSGHLSDLMEEVLLRRTKHLNDEKDIVPIDDIHNGSTLWRKYGKIKRYIQSTITC